MRIDHSRQLDVPVGRHSESRQGQNDSLMKSKESRSSSLPTKRWAFPPSTMGARTHRPICTTLERWFENQAAERGQPIEEMLPETEAVRGGCLRQEWRAENRRSEVAVAGPPANQSTGEILSRDSIGRQ